jgi:hypothetical protein
MKDLIDLEDHEMADAEAGSRSKKVQKGRGFKNKRTEMAKSGYETIPSSNNSGKAQASIEGIHNIN